MKAFTAALALLLLPNLLTAQKAPDWYRVYTFEDSVIDIDTKKVETIFGERGRVTFRWSFAKPEPLGAGSPLKYSSRLEVVEFDCKEKLYRPLGLTFLDSAGRVLSSEENNPSGPWMKMTSGGMTERMYTSACQLITPFRRVFEPAPEYWAEAQAAEKRAREFSERLDKTKDLAPLVREFFAPGYGGALTGLETDLPVTVSQETAAKVGSAELKRFHVALLNVSYLGGLYFLGRQSPPPGLVKLIEGHAYTASYGGGKGGYDFLAEKIENPERLRLYTDLLEKVAALFRREVSASGAEGLAKYHKAMDESLEELYKAKEWDCAAECFGLPRGTRLFQVKVPAFRLQLAEIDGEMKIVSAAPHFQ